MILSVVFLMLDAIEETFYRDYSTDISTGEKVFNILLSPIWPIWSLLLTSWTSFSTKIGLSDVEKDKGAKYLVFVSSHSVNMRGSSAFSVCIFLKKENERRQKPDIFHKR